MNSEFIRNHYPDARTRFRRDKHGPYVDIFGLAYGIPSEFWQSLFLANGFVGPTIEWNCYSRSYRIRVAD